MIDDDAEIDESDPWKDDPWEDRDVTDQWTELVAAYRRGNGKCGICGEPVVLEVSRGRHQPTIDHIYPLSLGGADTRRNIQIAHRGCNSRKGRKLPPPGEGERSTELVIRIQINPDVVQRVIERKIQRFEKELQHEASKQSPPRRKK